MCFFLFKQLNFFVGIFLQKKSLIKTLIYIIPKTAKLNQGKTSQVESSQVGCICNAPKIYKLPIPYTYILHTCTDCFQHIKAAKNTQTKKKSSFVFSSSRFQRSYRV